MAVAPVCSRCLKPHFNFVACDKADDWDSRRVVRVTGPPLSSVLKTVPEGFKSSSGWGVGDGFGRAWGSDGPQAA